MSNPNRNPAKADVSDQKNKRWFTASHAKWGSEKRAAKVFITDDFSSTCDTSYRQAIRLPKLMQQADEASVVNWRKTSYDG